MPNGEKDRARGGLSEKEEKRGAEELPLQRVSLREIRVERLWIGSHDRMTAAPFRSIESQSVP